jgi:heme-degrading monooxygenase HmoA
MYVIVWRFRARPDRLEAFEQVYGPSGDWARLFAEGKGYLGTELLRDTADVGEYLCVDRWESKEAFESFRAAWSAVYDELDARCTTYTEEETPLGAFEVIA